MNATAVAVVHVVFDLAIAQGPRIAVGGGVAMHVAQVGKAVLDGGKIRTHRRIRAGHRMVEHEACC